MKRPVASFRLPIRRGGLDYATVGMAIRRFETRCEREKRLSWIREKLKGELLS